MSRPLKVQIAERARDLIADEQHWCRRHLAEDGNGVSVSPTSVGAVKRCGLGAVIAAAYQLTHDYNTAHQLCHEALGPRQQRPCCGARVVRRGYRSGIGTALPSPCLDPGDVPSAVLRGGQSCCTTIKSLIIRSLVSRPVTTVFGLLY